MKAIDKTEDMKEKTIDNYNLNYPEAARVIHLYLKEFCDPSLTFPNMIADASRKASKEIERLRTIEPISDISKIETTEKEPEFDPSKPMEISMNGLHWFPVSHYVGQDSSGLYWAECASFDLIGWVCIRNIEPFHAGMLEVGEYLETEGGENIIRRISEREFFDIKNTGLPFYIDLAKELTGKRVKVNITTEEI